MSKNVIPPWKKTRNNKNKEEEKKRRPSTSPINTTNRASTMNSMSNMTVNTNGLSGLNQTVD